MDSGMSTSVSSCGVASAPRTNLICRGAADSLECKPSGLVAPTAVDEGHL